MNFHCLVFIKDPQRSICAYSNVKNCHVSAFDAGYPQQLNIWKWKYRSC